MKKIYEAEKYLAKDKLTNYALLEVIKRGSGKIIKMQEDGVLLFDEISSAYMLSTDNEDASEWMEDIHDCNLFHTTNKLCLDSVQKKYGLDIILDCSQFVYESKDYIEYEKHLDINEPLDTEMEVIRNNYDKLTEYELEKIRSMNNLYVGHDDSGEMVGFVGNHLEGSMGILEVLPKHRRNGYGTELEKFMINHVLEKGITPFCQVEAGNEKSSKLQQKLGLKESSKRVYWLFRCK